jgi:predicted ATPase
LFSAEQTLALLDYGGGYRVTPREVDSTRFESRILVVKVIAMALPSPAWYAVSGAPSSGKTTTVRLLAARGYRTTEEQARAIITEEIAKGRTLEEVRGAGEWFQEVILERQLALEAQLPLDETVFLDRGTPDGLAYERFLKLQPNPALAAAAQRSPYRRVFLLEPLDFAADHGRIEDSETQANLHHAIRDTYVELGFDVVDVPVLAPEERVDFILARL